MDPVTSPVREPAVAGRFYPGSADELARTAAELIGPGPAAEALGVMVPHAGYVYSGAIAGEVFGSVRIPQSCVILGPNHTGMGAAAAVMTAGSWRLPGGDVPIDTALAQSILSGSDLLSDDASAHAYEHSIEVQLPFLRHVRSDVRFVPVSLMLADAAACRTMGAAIARAIRELEREREGGVLIVASSDMTHFESRESAREKDESALAHVLALDPDGLLQTVLERNISMCGVIPAAVMLQACRELGARQARLVRYATSGDVSGDYSQVVGYAGIIVE